MGLREEGGGQPVAVRALVRGVGDIGSAVAHRFFLAGHAVAVHDGEQPTTTRHGMAFADAIFDGRATLDGVEAIRVDDPDAVAAILASRIAVPVVVGDFTAVLELIAPRVLIDARMRKRDCPEAQRGLAPLTIGLGPNFVAGHTTDVVVETSWEQLGRVVTRGATLPFRGEPRAITGHARDRYVYAPVPGTLLTSHTIGQHVAAGEVIARIDGALLAAPLSGVLRGLTHDGVPVAAGTKVIEIDPRGDPALVRGVTERPARIAGGVLQVLASLPAA
jgi:xanthine dehydrogenase accessory factor